MSFEIREMIAPGNENSFTVGQNTREAADAIEGALETEVVGRLRIREDSRLRAGRAG